MKKIFKKNQFIVTFLAVLIAVAGYLNYADNADKKKEAAKVNGTTYESVYDGDNLLTGDNDIESLDGEDANNKETKESAGEETTKEPGAAQVPIEVVVEYHRDLTSVKLLVAVKIWAEDARFDTIHDETVKILMYHSFQTTAFVAEFVIGQKYMEVNLLLRQNTANPFD